MSFRQFLFWLHLAAGLISGLAIGIMSFTGTVLAFEKEIVAWSERDARRIAPPPAAAARLTLDELRVKLRAAHPEVRPTGAVVHSDPQAAVAFNAGRSGNFYANPYTGEIRQPASTAVAGFMRTVTDLHRYLGLTGQDSRPVGKLINGVCNIAFLVLAVTGLYLWMPRSWSWRAVQPVIWFRGGLAGKARDFNWHNTVGFWCAPVLIVLTLTAMPISFRWAGTLLYTLTGTPLPASGPQSSGAPPPSAKLPAPAAGRTPVALEDIFVRAKSQVPGWQTATLRLSGDGAAQPATVTVKDATAWPRTALTTLQFDPFTGALLQRDGYESLSAARKIRAWTRYLHTGEAVGWLGQLLAGLASLGGVVLVYSGFALSWRRFFGKSAGADVTATAKE